MKFKIEMKLFIPLLIILSCHDTSKTIKHDHDSNLNEVKSYYNLAELPTYIDSLFMVDQKVQADIEEAFKIGATSDSLRLLYAIKDSTFKRHIPLLKLIYKNHGYPTKTKVGAVSASHFFTLVQHSDSDVKFQRQMLTLIKEEVAKGHVSGESYAYLTDRVLLADHKSQRFGTQLDYDDKGNAFPKNLANPGTCNERRAKYGLETLEDYLKFATESHRQMNPGKYD